MAVKCCMIFSNLLVTVAGLATVAVGACFFLNVTVVVDFFGWKNNYAKPTILSTLGGFMAVVAFMGFYGSAAQVVWMLVLFAMIMILLLIGGIACLVLVFVNISFFEFIKVDNIDIDNRTFQLYFSGFIGVIGFFEITAVAFACLLINRIRRKEEHC